MVTFSYSDTTSTFRFSAKNTNILLPSAIKKMAPEDQETIRGFCTTVRELYIKKIAIFMANNIGKKVCPIQIRHSSISEAISIYQEKLTPEVFNPLYAQFQSISQIPKPRKNTIMGKPKVRSYTALDLIEDDSDKLFNSLFLD